MTKTQREALQEALDFIKDLLDNHNIPAQECFMARALVEDGKLALAEPDVPEGWQLVPIEPTTNGVLSMVNAGAIAIKRHPDTPFMENRTSIATDVYKAMLAAAPKKEE